jgi:UDP-N-acetylmuramoylalanine-D-glutamate ligase
MNVAVIGTGVSGISVAHALVERGASVKIIDVAETLEPARQEIVDKFRTLPSEEWPEDELALIGENHSFGQDPRLAVA